MKKILLLVLVVCCMQKVAQSQYAFIDAQTIQDRLIEVKDGSPQFKQDSASILMLTGILRNYLSEKYFLTRDITDQQVLDHYKKNPFIGNLIQEVAIGGASAGMAGFVTTAVNQFRNMDVTNVADGLAQFMVERAKEELNIAFFEKFKEYMDDPRYSDFRILFPQTYLALSQIDSRIYNLNNYIQTLRESMMVDLVMLLENANGMMAQEKYIAFWDGHPELDYFVRLALKAGSSFQNGTQVGDMLTQLSEITCRPSHFDTNFRATLQVVNIFSQSLRDPGSTYWVSSGALRRGLYSDKVTAQLYLGLVYEEFVRAKIKFAAIDGRTILAEEMFLEVAKRYPDITKFLLQFSKNIDQLNETITLVQKGEGQSGKVMLYARLFNQSIDLIETTATLSQVVPTGVDPLPTNPNYLRFVVIARGVSDIAVDLSTKQFASAVVSFSAIMDSIFQFEMRKGEVSDLIKQANSLQKADAGFKRDRFATTLKEEANGYLEVPTSAWSEGVMTMVRASNDSVRPKAKNIVERINELIRVLNTQQSIQLFIQYGTFAANLVRAENAAEVKSALEAAALPVGSYRIKRQTAFNISLNGYVGATGGVQFGESNNSFVVGAWAPVGPAFSFGNFKQKKNSSSISIFIPVIDIGALALFRTSDDSTTLQTKVYLNQIFSPGLFISWGVPGLPLSLSAGYQMAPLLQSVSTGQTVLTTKNAGRVVVTLSVDIPLFNIYNAAGKKLRGVRVE